jgi:threonine/homoserine/homoserine lactone efflux protein
MCVGHNRFMTTELLIGLAVFALVSSIPPGPNNLMLRASGANFGFRRSVPHMLGVSIGFTVMVLLVGVGLMQVFQAYPVTFRLLKIVSVVYLVYLAWRIGTAAPPEGDPTATGKPLTFIQAALFQWVNPKAWTMALTAISAYSPSHSIVAIGFVAAIFGAINLPCISVWTTLGQRLAAVLDSPARLRLFNRLMAVLLLASLYPVLFEFALR